MKLIVFGASGGCGAHLVRQAAARGHQVTAIVRPSTAYAAPDGVSLVRGNVFDAAFVAAAVQSHEAVGSCLGIRYRYLWGKRQSPDDFISTATANIVSAMNATGARRISVISAAGVAESRPAANLVIRLLIATSNVGVAYTDLARVEEILRHSGLDWQAVRPTTLSSRRGTGSARVTTSFPATASIARSDVAAFMLAELERPAFTARTPIITG